MQFTKHFLLSTHLILMAILIGSSYFIWIYLFYESFHNMNFYYYLLCHRWGTCIAQGHTALKNKIWSKGDLHSNSEAAKVVRRVTLVEGFKLCMFFFYQQNGNAEAFLGFLRDKDDVDTPPA